MKWKKSKNAIESEDFLSRERELFSCDIPERKKSEEYKIYGLENVNTRIMQAKQNNDLIYVVGDYDCDGVMSLAEFDLIFKGSGITNYILRAPRRISEGYGLSFHIVEEIITYQPGLCILVDNGIAAYDQVEELVNYGWDVIIMDHHQCSADGKLPPADIIIDPEAIPGQADFIHYCGAGLVYKLACIMELAEEVKQQVLSYAAIATCADCVPFVDKLDHTYDNWLIVRNGLKSVITPTGRSKSLYVLLRKLNVDGHVTESDFGYRIGPIINASGRLYDDGAQSVLGYFANNDANFHYLEERAEELIATNNKRKDMQKEILEKVKDSIAIPEAGILVVYEPDIPEGIVGLVAGDITNNYQIPSIVFTNDSEGNLKGSARSVDDVNVIELIFACQEYLIRCGGHKKAAGLGVTSENYPLFKKAIEEKAGPYVESENVRYYDYLLNAKDAPKIWKQVEVYAPYGEGNSYPVFVIPEYEIDEAKIIGAAQTTIKMTTKKEIKLTAINFKGEGIEQYTDLGMPGKVALIGTLDANVWNGRTELQILFSEMKEPESFEDEKE